MNLIIKKLNRHGSKIRKPRGSVIPGNPRKVVVWYDDLSRAKKPPAWIKEILFGKDAA
jgi:hypothetical protein